MTDLPHGDYNLVNVIHNLPLLRKLMDWFNQRYSDTIKKHIYPSTIVGTKHGSSVIRKEKKKKRKLQSVANVIEHRDNDPNEGIKYTICDHVFSLPSIEDPKYDYVHRYSLQYIFLCILRICIPVKEAVKAATESSVFKWYTDGMEKRWMDASFGIYTVTGDGQGKHKVDLPACPVPYYVECEIVRIETKPPRRYTM